MSKYTTEVRFICENLGGLQNSADSNSVDTIISKSWDKIFTTKCEFFDENYRKTLCCKIIKHYYTREIGAETFGLWKLWMNTKLEEIMPYYNQLYESAKIEFNPMHDVDLTREHKRTENEKTNGNLISTNNSTNNSKELYSDTPQGSITNLENSVYLTNATITENENNSNSDSTTTNNVNTTEDYIETITGKQGTESFSSLLNKFRETFLNIDMQVIDEFSDLFFGLW